jgi:hypothetical protein
MRRNSACAQRSQDHPSSTSSSRRSALPNKVEARGDVQEANLSKILYEGERGEKKYGKENKCYMTIEVKVVTFVKIVKIVNFLSLKVCVPVHVYDFKS